MTWIFWSRNWSSNKNFGNINICCSSITKCCSSIKCVAAALIDVASVLMFTADFAIHIFADELVFGLTIVLLDSFASDGAFWDSYA